MAKFHINDDGNVGKCSADEGKCPFGSDAPHFDNKQDAQKHYETIQQSKTFSQPVIKTKIYRVGTLEAPEDYFDDLSTVLKDMDKFKPEGRQGRYKGIFASPDITSHGKWVRGMQDNKHEGALDSYEITVDENSVYVYNVQEYEKASSIQNLYGGDSEEFKEAAETFWNNGMTLHEWKKWAKENKPERGSWEIIMPPESILSTKKMSNRSVIENMSDMDASEVNRILEPKRSQKGLIWRKNNLTDEQKEKIREVVDKEFDENFVNDMEKIYSKNAYKIKDIYSARKEIYSAFMRESKKRNDDMKTFASLNRDETQAFFKNIERYIKIVEENSSENMSNEQ